MLERSAPDILRPLTPRTRAHPLDTFVIDGSSPLRGPPRRSADPTVDSAIHPVGLTSFDPPYAELGPLSRINGCTRFVGRTEVHPTTARGGLLTSQSHENHRDCLPDSADRKR